MYLEYDWTYGVFRPRFGHVFIDVAGYRSFSSMDEAKQVLGWRGLKVGSKSDSRSWNIELAR